MAKACVVINKIKSFGTLKSRWNHDLNKSFREEHVKNAESDLYDQNDILVKCTDEDGIEISYDKAVKNRIKDLSQSNGKKIKKDAVLAYDIVLEFGDTDDVEAEGIDIDEWEKRSVEWLKETFDIAGDKKNNVLSVVCHKDELSPHIHAIVTPVDDRGSLCARSFTNGSSVLSKFQDTYAKKLEDLGIERGTKGSSAHHKSNRAYHDEIKKAATLPTPEPNQSAIDYLIKYQFELEARAVEEKRKMDKLIRTMRANADKEISIKKELTDKELENLMHYYDVMEKDINSKISELQSQETELTEKVKKLSIQQNEYEEYTKLKTLLDNASDLLKEKYNEVLALIENEYIHSLDEQETEI